jgi:hypothetical protein
MLECVANWELVLRRPDEPDEVVSMSADNIVPGETFVRGGITWLVGYGEEPTLPDHLARLICRPLEPGQPETSPAR